MSLGTVLSRLTGVVRLAAMAAALGIAETRLTDTYNIANSVPNVIYELVLGGVVTAVFVPFFVELLGKEERDRAWEVMCAILNISLLALSAIAAAGVLAAPWIAGFYASRLEGPDVGAQQEAIEFLLRFFIPQVVLYGLFFILAGMLNAHKRFGPPHFTQIVNNLVLIAVFVWFRATYGTVTLHSATTTHLLILGAGTTLSVAPMGVGLIPFIRKLGGYRWTIRAEHPAIRTLARSSVAVVGFVMANQVGYVVIQWIANGQQGGFSAYVSAFTFFLLPIGLFVWPLTTALMPSMSEHAVNGRWDAFATQLSTGIRATIFLLVPASVGFFLLAEPMVRVLLQHGVATAASTELVAGVLRLLVSGLVPFALFQLFVRASYAQKDTRKPFVVNCLVIAVNTAVNVPMFALLGARGLGAGMAIAYTLGAVVQGRMVARSAGGWELASIADGALRTVAAAAGMGVCVWGALTGLGHLFGDGAGAAAVEVAVGVAVGGLTFLALARALKVNELSYVVGLFKPTRSSSAPSREGRP